MELWRSKIEVVSKVPTTTSDGSGIRNPGYGFWNCHGEMGLKDKLNKAVLHFLPNSCHIWWFFKVERTEGDAEKLWKIIIHGKISANFEEKPSSTCFKPIFWLIMCTRKLDFGYTSIHHYTNNNNLLLRMLDLWFHVDSLLYYNF